MYRKKIVSVFICGNTQLGYSPNQSLKKMSQSNEN